MTNTIYLFKTERVNVVNLLQFCAILSDEWYEICQPHISDTNYMSTTVGNFVQQLSPADPMDFRNIDWSTQVYKLEEIADATDLNLMVGVKTVKQLLFLKEYFGDRSKTISISYDESSYGLMLDFLVQAHIEEQQLSVDLIEHYKQEFDTLGLLSKQLEPVGEYNVPFEDFFNKIKFFKHLKNIGLNPSVDAEAFYDKWRIQNESK